MKLPLFATAALFCTASTVASADILTNNSFEADPQGDYDVADPGFTYWRLFAGGGNSGGYDWDLIGDASDGNNALQITRSNATGGGGGIDNNNEYAEIDPETTYRVQFDAKDLVESGTDLDSSLRLEVRFSETQGGSRFGGGLTLVTLTDDYQTFSSGDFIAPANAEFLYVGFRPLTGAQVEGPTGVILDNVRVIPEPASLALLGLGGLLLLPRRSR
jgi:hypothetical protein